MNEKMRKRLVYSSLVLAVIYGAYNFSSGGKQLIVEESHTIEPIAGTHSPIVEKLRRETITKLESEDWGRDPFGKPKRAVEAVPRQTWTLRGIIFSPTNPLAYINGARVGVGDKVNNATVVAIDKRKVTLEFGGSQFDVYVRKG